MCITLDMIYVWKLYSVLHTDAGGTDLGKVTRGPKSTVVSINLNWKTFKTTGILASVGCPTRLSNQGKIVLVRDKTKKWSLGLRSRSCVQMKI